MTMEDLAAPIRFDVHHASEAKMVDAYDSDDGEQFKCKIYQYSD